MQIFETKSLQTIDAECIEFEQISSLELMERATEGLLQTLLHEIGIDHSFLLIAGPGNNGGDTLALARLLHQRGATITCCVVCGDRSLSRDLVSNRERLIDIGINVPLITKQTAEYLDTINPHLYTVIIDGLFGSGLNRPLSGEFAEATMWINHQRERCRVVAIDLPSGLYGENNDENHLESVVHADITLTISSPKLSLLLPETEQCVGKWVLSPLHFPTSIIRKHTTPYHLTEEHTIVHSIKPRGRFSHKGNYGHGLLIAACHNMCGAAILAAKASLRAGIGLITIHLPESVYQIVQTAIPEAIVSRDRISPHYFSSTEGIDLSRYSAVAIGPGMGVAGSQANAMRELLSDISIPLVIDADGINNISQHRDLISLLPPNTILTPHPKEFDRLIGRSATSAYQRLQSGREFAVAHSIYIILKGAYTAVITPEGNVWFNPTGNCGMATAGSGDVLCGMVLSLLAQGYSSFDACRVATYLHGLAGDIALQRQSLQSLIASDIIDSIGAAYNYIIEQL